MTTTYLVAGMTCGHCVAAVTEEIGRLSGVTSVDIDLVTEGSSRVLVSSHAQLSVVWVRATVDAAGYELVGGLA